MPRYLPSARKHADTATESFRSNIDEFCDEYLARLREYALPQGTRGTDRAVLMALACRCRLDQSLRFRASEREVAELANLGHNTVGKALRRLATSNWESGAPAFITAHARADNFAAGEYSLIMDVLPPLDHPPTRTLECAAFRTGNLSHDAFAPKRRQRNDTNADNRAADTIGKSALACLQWLRAHPGSTAAEVAAGTGVAKRTAERALASLESIHEAARVETDNPPLETVGRPPVHWQARPLCEEDLDRIARNAGTRGRTDKKRLRHEAERHFFEEWEQERAKQRRHYEEEMEKLEAERASWSPEQRLAWEAEQQATADRCLAEYRADKARRAEEIRASMSRREEFPDPTDWDDILGLTC